jgi:hypothetical protein
MYHFDAEAGASPVSKKIHEGLKIKLYFHTIYANGILFTYLTY